MSDFLDRLGGQLLVAGEALSARPAPKHARRRLRLPRRTAALSLAAVMVTGTALAATQPWAPSLGRPELRDVPASRSASDAPGDQVALLGVLARPQDSADRGARTQELLRHLGVEASGVRTDSIRALTSPSGEDAVLVSVQHAGAVAGAAESGQSDALCVLVAGGGFCGNTDDLRAGRFMVLAGDHVYGLVPDGVSRVEFDYPGGQTRSAGVRDNFYAVTDVPVTTRNVPGPGGGSAPLVMPERPAIRWLDSSGSPVGPPPAK
jgi:hypothetical protein